MRVLGGFRDRKAVPVLLDERRAAHRQPGLFEDVLAGRGDLDVEP